MNQKQTILLSAIAIYLVVAVSVAGGFAYTYQRAASDLNCTTVLDERAETAGERIERLSQLLRSTERVIQRLPADFRLAEALDVDPCELIRGVQAELARDDEK